MCNLCFVYFPDSSWYSRRKTQSKDMSNERSNCHIVGVTGPAISMPTITTGSPVLGFQPPITHSRLSCLLGLETPKRIQGIQSVLMGIPRKLPSSCQREGEGSDLHADLHYRAQTPILHQEQFVRRERLLHGVISLQTVLDLILGQNIQNRLHDLLVLATSSSVARWTSGVDMGGRIY